MLSSSLHIYLNKQKKSAQTTVHIQEETIVQKKPYLSYNAQAKSFWHYCCVEKILTTNLKRKQSKQ